MKSSSFSLRIMRRARSKTGSIDPVNKVTQPSSKAAPQKGGSQKGGSKSGHKGGKKGAKKGRHQQYDLIVTIDLVEHGLTEELVADLKEAFMLFDKDEDGVLNMTELGVMMKSLGQRPSEMELERMMSSVDQDGSGQIEFNEFLQMMALQTAALETEDALRDAFRCFDKEDAGFLPVAELRHILTSMGDKMTGDEVDLLLREADRDESGRVNYAEFVQVLLTQRTPAK